MSRAQSSACGAREAVCENVALHARAGPARESSVRPMANERTAAEAEWGPLMRVLRDLGGEALRQEVIAKSIQVM